MVLEHALIPQNLQNELKFFTDRINVRDHAPIINSEFLNSEFLNSEFSNIDLQISVMVVFVIRITSVIIISSYSNALDP